MSPGNHRHLWAIVLAEGEETLRGALEALTPLVPANHIRVVVNNHRRWWESELSHHLRRNVIVQPSDCGTAAGILLPLLDILKRDREADILVIPPEYDVDKEKDIESALAHAASAVRGSTNRIVLLGNTPNTLDWESFIIATSGTTLLRLYAQKAPHLLKPFLLTLSDRQESWSGKALAGIYDTLPRLNFSKAILEQSEEYLWILPVLANKNHCKVREPSLSLTPCAGFAGL